MFFGAKNETLTLGDASMDYISFGHGAEPLILLPGLGDGLRTVKGTAIPVAMAYRKFAKRYKVYAFSRKSPLEQGTSTRDMARDVKTAMDALGIAKAHLIGVSQGGMIAQYVAIDYPDAVSSLVLAVTLARQNPTIQKAVGHWLELAAAGDYRGLVIDTAEKSYSEPYLKKYRRLYPLLVRIGKPKDFGRFMIQAAACLRHDAYEELDRIQCRTLVIGGGQDQIVGPDSAAQIAEKITRSRLLLFEPYGHGVYEQAKDFNDLVSSFFEG